MAEEGNLCNRLASVTKQTVLVYCRLFGYSKIRVSEKCAIASSDLERLGLAFGDNLITNDPTEADSFELHIDPPSEVIDTRDHLSSLQFSIDLEAVSSMPICLVDNLSRMALLEKIHEYIDVFSERGWIVLCDLRPSLAPLLKDRNEKQVQVSIEKSLGVLVVCDSSLEMVGDLSNAYGKNTRVEGYWFAYFLREWAVELLCHEYKKAFVEKGIAFECAHWAWGFDHFLGSGIEGTSEIIQARKSYSREEILKNVKQYSLFLSHIFNLSANEALTRFVQVATVPPVIDSYGGAARHSDTKSKFLNVVNGNRFTTDCPGKWTNTVHLFGGCTFFGYAVEDENTVASALQRHLNRKWPSTYKVVNHGTWGGNFENCHMRISEISFRSGDIVLISYAMGNSFRGWFDLSESLTDIKFHKDEFYDRVVHCGMYGYGKIAEEIVKRINGLSLKTGSSKQEVHINAVDVCGAGASKPPKGLEEFVADIKSRQPFLRSDNATVGALVVNCNPFTLGHRYLIEYAADQVDSLYVFVVEEDKSFFPFDERIELVKKGTADLDNVFVCRSGEFMISAKTFPGYFVKENPGSVTVDPSLDVEFFGKWIAPEFDITVRFVGAEPFDKVTNEYNQKMASMLPRYGVDLVEIPRKIQEIDGDEVAISASNVRRLMSLGDFTQIKKLVPATTYDYLLGFAKD